MISALKEIEKIQNPVNNLKVIKIHRIYKDNGKGNIVDLKPMYNVVHAKIPFNPNSYVVIDKELNIDNLGSFEMSFKGITENKANKLYEKAEWFKKDMSVRELIYPLEPLKCMKILKKYKIEFKKLIDFWLYEGCKKDERIVNIMKSSIIPIRNFDPTTFQKYNSHSFMITNTGTGKTTFAYILGESPGVDPTVAGLFGGNVNEYNDIIKGKLNGDGIHFLDEINVKDTDIISSILAYLENGNVTRNLKVPITCIGTKTIILNGNPEDTCMVEGLSKFLRAISNVDTPDRIGRRFGFILIGNDYISVDSSKSDSRFRDLIRRLVFTSINKYIKQINSIIKDNLNWINEIPKEVIKEIESKTACIPNKVIKRFFKGYILGLYKVKMASIRYLILENLDLIVLNKIKKLKEIIKKQRDEVFNKLISINMDSINKLSYIYLLNDDKKEFCLNLAKRYPNMSLREISSIIDISKSTVERWINDN